MKEIDAFGLSRWGEGRTSGARETRRVPPKDMHKMKADALRTPLLNDRDSGPDGGADRAAMQLQKVYMDPANFVGSGGVSGSSTIESAGIMSRSTYARWRGKAIDIDAAVSHGPRYS